MPVLVENAAEEIAAAYVEAGDRVRNSDRCGQWIQRAGILGARMRPMGVVELFEHAQGVERMPLIPDQRAVRQLAPADRPTDFGGLRRRRGAARIRLSGYRSRTV